MHIKQLSHEGLEHSFQITIPHSTIDDKITARYTELSHQVKISGFRPGKIPLNIIAQRYDDSVRPEVLRTVIDDAVQKLISEKQIKAAMQPSVDIESYEKGQDLVCVINVESLPVIPAIDLKKITGERLVAPVGDQQINKQLDNIARNNKSTQPLADERPAKLGDTVVIDFDGSTQDGPIQGGSGKEYKLELGSGSFIPGFEDQLVGLNKGDAKDITVNFPQDYNAAELAGKEATFKIKVHDILQTVALAFDDDQAVKLGFKSLNDIKEFIHNSLKLENDKMSFHVVKKNILDQLDIIKIDLPKKLVEHEFKLVSSEYLKEQNGAHHHDDHVHTENCQHESHQARLDESTEKELRDLAARRVRLGLILAEIGKNHSVEVTDEEMNQALMNQARQYPGQEKSVYDYFKKNPQAMQSLRAPLYEDKVINVILSESVIKDKEVSYQELEKIIKQLTEDDKEE